MTASLGILTPHGLLLFIAAALIFSLSPGPTVLLISAYGFKAGLRAALAAIAGTQTGNGLWFGICVAGFGALVTRWPALFHSIKLVGAAYLIWLGGHGLWKGWRGQDCDPALLGRPYLQAALTQIGNPKALLFFGALVPQFLDMGAPLLPQYGLMLLIIFLGESMILSAYAALAAAGGRISGLAQGAWRQRIGAAALLALGILAALA